MPPKRDQCAELLHVGGASVAGLGKILRKTNAKRVGRNALLKANKQLLGRCLQSETLELTEGGEFTWEYADYNILLPELVEASDELQELFSVAARTHPCSQDSPWRLVLAMDEYTPGDKRKPKNRRKCMVFSVNLLELGYPALTHELTWLTPAVLRTGIIQKTIGGWSRCLRVLLHMLLTSPLAVGRVGVALNLHGKAFLLFANVYVILTDLDGHRQVFDWNGAGSCRPCASCRNLWRKDYPVLPNQVIRRTMTEALSNMLDCHVESNKYINLNESTLR